MCSDVLLRFNSRLSRFRYVDKSIMQLWCLLSKDKLLKSEVYGIHHFMKPETVHAKQKDPP